MLLYCNTDIDESTVSVTKLYNFAKLRKEQVYNSIFWGSVFSIGKSLWVLKEACIKIATHAIYTDWFFSFIYILLFCCKEKYCWDCCFLPQIRSQTTIQLYILQEYSSVKIGFNMNSKNHPMPIVYTMLVQMCYISLNDLSFNHYCFQSLTKM